MKIYIKAKPNSKKVYIRKIDNTHFTVAVKEPPVSGKANRAVIYALSGYFKKPASQISIIHGEKSKNKILDIPLTVVDLEETEGQKKLF